MAAKKSASRTGGKSARSAHKASNPSRKGAKPAAKAKNPAAKAKKPAVRAKKPAAKAKTPAVRAKKPAAKAKKPAAAVRKTAKPRPAPRGRASAAKVATPIAPLARPRVLPTPAGKEARLTKKDLEHFREKLFVRREQITGRISVLKEESLSRRDKIITEEDGTDAFDREFSLNLASNEQEIVFEIDEALRRIEQGTFGICQASGRPIARARLEAIPYVRLCIEAQEEKDRGTPRFIDSRRVGAAGADWQDAETVAGAADGE